MADKKVELNNENLEEVAGGFGFLIRDLAQKNEKKKEEKKDGGNTGGGGQINTINGGNTSGGGNASGGGQTNTINGANGKQQNNQNVNYKGAVNNSF